MINVTTPNPPRVNTVPKTPRVRSDPSAAAPLDPNKPWISASRPCYRLVDASLIDSKDGSIHQHVTIELRDGKIYKMVKLSTSADGSSDQTSIGTPQRGGEDPAGNPQQQQHQQTPGQTIDHAGPDVTVINLNGRFIIPGLIDCHVHLSTPPGEGSLRETLGQDPLAPTTLLRQPFLAREMLRRGFTSVRDCGGAPAALRDALEDNLFPGPRVFVCGHAISQTGGHGDLRGPGEGGADGDGQVCCGGARARGLGRVADGVEECRRAAREELRRGADFLKVMVGGGVVSPTDAITDTQYTVEEIRAIVMAAEDAGGKRVTAHAYTPAAVMRAVEAGCAGIEHGNLIDERTAMLMAGRGVFLTPTLCTYEAMASSEFAGGLPGAVAEKNRQVLKAGLRSLLLAEAAGVTMCYGTDLLGAAQRSQTREFVLRKMAGLSNLTILQSATINAARMLGQGDRLGRLKEGHAADLLILNANPLDDIEVLDRPERHLLAVIKDGRILESRWSELTKESDQVELIE